MKRVAGLGPLGEESSDDHDDDATNNSVTSTSTTAASSAATSRKKTSNDDVVDGELDLSEFHMPTTNAAWYETFKANFVDKAPSDDMLFFVRPNW